MRVVASTRRDRGLAQTFLKCLTIGAFLSMTYAAVVQENQEAMSPEALEAELKKVQEEVRLLLLVK